MSHLPSRPPRRPQLLNSNAITRFTPTSTSTSRSPSDLQLHHRHQTRHATFIARPRRPYQFTQLITLSDGSTVTQRTTAPHAVFRSQKDTRNTLLWNPSSARLASVETDEGGRLSLFRKRFGRGFDGKAREESGLAGQERKEEVEMKTVDQGGELRDEAPKEPETRSRESQTEPASRQQQQQWSDEDEDNLMDLISEDFRVKPQESPPPQPASSKGKGKGGKAGKGRR